ncbi:MAG: peptidoglycan DD-metalloendopeptidase family protein [Candidatus Hinthialibacter antarcticus]|nr:peptidoglycan DD-metalloendopeptidase family protein [Candidatus Hinthialibacter antarcticus]
MADFYLNPLDTAPVTSSSPPIRNRVVPPQPASFSELLDQASTQAPSPMLKPNALLTPATGSEPLIQQAPVVRSESMGEAAQERFQSDEELKKQLADILPPMSKPVSSVTSTVIETAANPAPGLEMAPAQNEHLWDAIYEPKQVNDVSVRPARPVEYVFQAPAQNQAAAKNTPVLKSEPVANEAVAPVVETAPVEENWQPVDSNYRVQRGDTLSQIVVDTLRGQQIDFSTRDIYRLVGVMSNANELSNPNRILAGQNLDLSPIQEFVIARRDSDKSVAMNTDAQMPASGPITSAFGMRHHPIDGEWRQHNGIDIGVQNGTPIQPIQDGTVVYSGEQSGYGNVVDVSHGDGLVSRYAHLSERFVEAGDQIRAGETVGLSGQTGNATGPHLHLEVMRGGQPVDPMGFLPMQSIAQR